MLKNNRRRTIIILVVLLMIFFGWYAYTRTTWLDSFKTMGLFSNRDTVVEETGAASDDDYQSKADDIRNDSSLSDNEKMTKLIAARFGISAPSNVKVKEIDDLSILTDKELYADAKIGDLIVTFGQGIVLYDQDTLDVKGYRVRPTSAPKPTTAPVEESSEEVSEEVTEEQPVEESVTEEETSTVDEEAVVEDSGDTDSKASPSAEEN